jgi:hypothetical protein
MCRSNTLSTDNDEDFDEDNIPGFSHPSPAAQSPLPSKGKGRAPPEQLAPPGAGSRPQSPNVSGNIGSSNANGNVGGTAARRTIGGVQVETRYDIIFFGFGRGLTSFTDTRELIPSTSQSQQL